ncbi:competence/damage-inducible protein A [Halobacillus salinus]|uniref:competence/damage-inducible protein A n=1 Tax=Halobacillus salinus TaxID=192814 RepID=UPI0009A72062|nr:competence/damage-inducible protein A [Halobacillus salinus]
MKTEMIAVGTELLLGQIVNTNAQWISKQLATLGMPIYHQSVVGDNYDRVFQTFEAAHNRSDVIIVTGGLGPTEDDMTRDAAKPLIGQDLVIHQPSLSNVENYYKKNKRTMTDNNRKQALVFEQAQVLLNNEGMAPGQIVEVDGRIWVFLPGVPQEMKMLMNEHVLPYFKETFQLKSEIMSEMMRFIGIGESSLEEEVSDLIRSQTNPTIAPLAGDGEVGLRITATGETDKDASDKIAKMKEQILTRVGKYYYGSDDTTIEETVRDLLKEKNMTVGSAESLTGGLFAERMISLPGASSVCQGSLVAYTPFTKEMIIEVPKFIIKEFGTISYEFAEVMALNAQSLLYADVAISFTGVAGPEASEGKEPGTVFIGLQIGERKPIVHECHFDGGRDKIRMRAVKKGYELIYHNLKK